MRKCSSVVWEFFERIINDNSKCVAAACKLCEREIKFCGNTTNLRSHLITKHPLQWEFRHGINQPSSVEPSADENSNMESPSVLGKRSKRRSRTDDGRYSVSINKPKRTHAEITMPTIEIHRVTADDSDPENDVSLASMKLERNKGEEWLDDDYDHIINKLKPKRKVQRKIKQEYLQQPMTSPVECPSSPKDEFTAFGEYIAQKLRNLNSLPARQNVQQLITTILWQAEFGAYEDIDGVKKILISSLQETETTHTSENVDVNTESNETV